MVGSFCSPHIPLDLARKLLPTSRAAARVGKQDGVPALQQHQEIDAGAPKPSGPRVSHGSAVNIRNQWMGTSALGHQQPALDIKPVGRLPSDALHSVDCLCVIAVGAAERFYS